MAESLPTSISAFAHHRQQRGSMTSFSYYNEEDDDGTSLDLDDTYERRDSMDTSDFPILDGASDDEDHDPLRKHRASQGYVLHRRQSGLSITSASARLLRSDSITTTASGRLMCGRTSQKTYLPNEDMTIAIAGFRTRSPALWVYRLLCAATCGLSYVVFRWFPRWYIRVFGQPCALRECDWLVVEVGDIYPAQPT